MVVARLFWRFSRAHVLWAGYGETQLLEQWPEDNCPSEWNACCQEGLDNLKPGHLNSWWETGAWSGRILGVELIQEALLSMPFCVSVQV